jgi:isopenicillin-N N-acyltransferase-like protein
MFPVLELTESPLSRGRAYGRAQATRVRHSIASYARLFAFLRGWDWAESRARASAYVDVLRRAAPHLVDEMRGIADGSERAFDEILALNVRTELLAGSFATGQHADFDAATARNVAAGVPQHRAHGSGGGDAELSECTTVAALPGASNDGRTWLAQNWDWIGDQRAACVMLRVREAGRPAILTLAEAGMVGKSGINSAGVAVALNILASQLDGQQPGMPVHVLLRLMLECRSLDEAVALASSERSGASSCITVADASGRVICLEITPAGVGELHPTDDVLVHSNHCVTSTALPVACPIAKTSSTRERFARAEDLMNAGRGRIDAAYLAGVLRDEHDKPLCINREPDMSLHPCLRSESVCGLIMDVRERVLHVAPDVPSRATFHALPVA